MSSADAKTLGDRVETHSLSGLSAVEAVSDEQAEWYDGVLIEPVREDVPGPLVYLSPGRRVEHKAAQATTSNGSRDSDGRWYFRRPQHERLVADGAVYLLVVYEIGADGQPGVLARCWIAAAHLDALLAGRWSESGRGHQVAKLRWPDLIARSEVFGGGD